MQKIYIVRHGETDHNAERILIGNSTARLNSKGIEQAKNVAEYFKGKEIDRIYSSLQNRAIETAKIISNLTSVHVKTHPSLEERNYGDYEGLTIKNLIEKRVERKFSPLDPTQNWDGIPNVESDQAIAKRVTDFIYSLPNLKNIILVTHAGVTKSLLHSIFEIPSKKINCFKISNGSVSLLVNKDKQLELNELIPNHVFK